MDKELTIKVGAQSNVRAGFGQARSEVDQLVRGLARGEAVGGGGSGLSDVRGMFGRGSEFTLLTKTLAGGGAILGLGLAAREFATMAEKARELADALRDGSKSSQEIGLEFVQSLPILGSLVKGAVALQDALLGYGSQDKVIKEGKEQGDLLTALRNRLAKQQVGGDPEALARLAVEQQFSADQKTIGAMPTALQPLMLGIAIQSRNLALQAVREQFLPENKFPMEGAGTTTNYDKVRLDAIEAYEDSLPSNFGPMEGAGPTLTQERADRETRDRMEEFKRDLMQARGASYPGIESPALSARFHDISGQFQASQETDRADLRRMIDKLGATSASVDELVAKLNTIQTSPVAVLQLGN